MAPTSTVLATHLVNASQHADSDGFDTVLEQTLVREGVRAAADLVRLLARKLTAWRQTGKLPTPGDGDPEVSIVLLARLIDSDPEIASLLGEAYQEAPVVATGHRSVAIGGDNTGAINTGDVGHR